MRSTPFRVIEAEALHSKRAVFLARWLLGKFLVRRFADRPDDARMILETEAYCGENDLACHARAGRTKRTEVMYAEGGVWYVYLCYGIHEMLNLVVGPRDWPAAILIRGVEGAIGPGRVTKALAIDRQLNAKAVAPSSGLWLEDRGVYVPRAAVKVTPRIGVDYAGPIWSAKHWRFTCDPKARPSPRPAHPKLGSNPARRRFGSRERAEQAAPTSRDP
jgi:DNA-3-methyladenine glycosylase